MSRVSIYRVFGINACAFSLILIFLYYFGEHDHTPHLIVPQHFNRIRYGQNTTNGYKATNSFKQAFLDFPWDAFENAVARNLTIEIISYSERLIDKLTYFVGLESPVPLNQQCKPPLLPASTDIDCTLYPDAFTGVKRTKTAKVGALLQFGFDVDVLEIHLNELFDVVDKFFIIESTHAHYGNLKKPLMWERVKGQERFKKFPVIHLIVDDATPPKATDEKWSMELLQEQVRWRRFLKWNRATHFFCDDDIIGFGDVDEIPNRSKLHMFKYCEIREISVDFGIWFPFGHINQAFQSDYPVISHPLTLGDPTFYKLATARRSVDPNEPNEFPSRKRGRSGNYILGGIHMTHYGYLPFQIIKHLTATEGGLRALGDLQRLSKYLKVGDIRDMEIDLAATPAIHMPKTIRVNLSNPEMKEICILPWFYDCNRKRYPVWEGGHDTRLD